MKILISDTHFGVRQNSIVWINSQLDFFYNQLIPFLDVHNNEDIEIIHLGDVFDSRSSINPLIANKVKKLFDSICRKGYNVYIIGGNHDYYSPNESLQNDNSIDLILGELCYYCPNLKLITKNFYKQNNELFVPWFRYFDYDELKKQLKDIDTVYIHNDLVMIDPKYQQLFEGKTIYSGHIHTPCHINNLHTLGSVFALTFADSNSERGFYVVHDHGQLEFIHNEKSIRFWRFYNDEIFKKLPIKNTDYVELYIDQENLIKPNYVETIKELSKQINNLNVIPKTKEVIGESVTDFTKYDITDICKKKIPKNLINKFELISKEENE